jgi:hypothetical protein
MTDLEKSVQKFATRISKELHNGFEKQDNIHRDAMNSGLSPDTTRV